MDSEIITIGMYEEEKEIIKYKFLVKNHKFTPSLASETLKEDNFSSRCIIEKKEIIILDIETEYPNFVENSQKLWDEKLLSQVYIPLQVEDRVIGIFSVQSYNKDAYNINQLSILRTMASYIAIAIDNADAYKEISKKNKQIKEQMDKVKI
jgi:transcriptional regulator with GAF, ATPase, and Fis domain